MISSLPSPVLIMSLLLTIALSAGCPPSCICKWRNGKQTVECIGKSFSIIPEGVDTATQVLDVSGNNFQYVQRENFLKMGLINLQKLFLNRCAIKIIEDDALKGLTNLVELDLSENMLEAVPTEALLNCPSLMRLSLSKNPIRSLDRLAFNHLSFLTTLDVSGCEISEVDEAAFSSLYSLEWIDISQNKMRRFPDMRLLPDRLKGIQLQENPWTCDCHIRTFSSWLKKDIVPILIAPACREPRKYRGLPVRGMNEEELACAPEVSPSNFYFELEEGKNVTLLCQIKSTPAAKVSWLFKGHVLQNNTELIPGVHLLYFIEEGAEQKESSLFIYNLNSENNGTFYCIAENSAGVASANYTLRILLKQAPIRLEEETGFPIDWLSILLALGLVISSLCFVAVIMTVCQRQSKTKRRKKEEVKKSKEMVLPKDVLPKKSILKSSSDNQKTIFMTEPHTTELDDLQSYQVMEQNPDIINGINNGEHSSVLLNNLVPRLSATLPYNVSNNRPILINPSTMNRQSLQRQRTQPYLKPTLTSTFRPVSAPTFERYVENYDLRHTADGYPNSDVKKYVSYSEASSPMMKARRPGHQIIEVQAQKQIGSEMGSFKDDVPL